MDPPEPSSNNPTTASKPSALTSISHSSPLLTGNGESIFTTSILPLLATAKHEILLVTCFWAASPTLSAVSELLLKLSDAHLARSPSSSRLRVRIGFSSRSLLQKVLHTSSPKGHIYPPSTWSSKLGLPGPEQLKGLDLQVKSIFYLPFSVLHPKLIIIDRDTAILPSCNVSWECWLECCIHVSGPIVAHLLSFWRDTWGKDDFPALPTALRTLPTEVAVNEDWVKGEMTLLPSSHHRNPRFHPWPLAAPPPPPTPLNTKLLQLFHQARQEIYIVTPNLTSPPVLSALLAALERGVDVRVVTNRKMMLIEQLLTAGTITEICVWRLQQWHKTLTRKAVENDGLPQVEHGRAVGHLSIRYFKHRRKIGQEVKCHIKCTIVDDRVVVLGSGNMDRASWYTSQELGVAIVSREVAEQVKSELDRVLRLRV